MRVFDGVKILAWAEHRDNVEYGYRQVNGPGIEFCEVPYYVGPGSMRGFGTAFGSLFVVL